MNDTDSKAYQETNKDAVGSATETCPHCGYCPHCGRSGPYITPFYPYYPTFPNQNIIYC